jgi:hypothetical protein
MVDKYIGAVITGNKAETFGIIKPLYCSVSHCVPPYWLIELSEGHK